MMRVAGNRIDPHSFYPERSRWRTRFDGRRQQSGLRHAVFNDWVLTVTSVVDLDMPGEGRNAVSHHLIGNPPHQRSQKDHAPNPDDDRAQYDPGSSRVSPDIPPS